MVKIYTSINTITLDNFKLIYKAASNYKKFIMVIASLTGTNFDEK